MKEVGLETFLKDRFGKMERFKAGIPDGQTQCVS